MPRRVEVHVEDDLLDEVVNELKRRGQNDASASRLIESLLAEWLARAEARERAKRKG